MKVYAFKIAHYAINMNRTAVCTLASTLARVGIYCHLNMVSFVMRTRIFTLFLSREKIHAAPLDIGYCNVYVVHSGLHGGWACMANKVQKSPLFRRARDKIALKKELLVRGRILAAMNPVQSSLIYLVFVGNNVLARPFGKLIIAVKSYLHALVSVFHLLSFRFSTLRCIFPSDEG